jgi:hypothetical protein
VRRFPVIFVLLIAGGITAALMLHGTPPSPPAPPAPIAASQPTPSAPTTRKAKPIYLSYMQLLRQRNPAVATTQPLDDPLELPDAAHLIIPDPVYLDPAGHLWITSSQGMPTASALVKPAETYDHIIQDRPVFVHWALNDAGNWDAVVILHNPAGGYDFISKADRQHLAVDRPFNWSAAFSVQDKIVVPTDIGVDILSLNPKPVEYFHLLPGVTHDANPPRMIADTRGILAWSPWENGKPGSNGVSRFVQNAWTDLPSPDWPARPVQLSILLDGSVLRIAAGIPATQPTDVADAFPDQLHFSIGSVEPPQFDEKHIDDLIAQLSDPDGDVRRSAFDELSRYGPAISIKLRKVMDDQGPEARLRIGQLLHKKVGTTLAGMIPVDDRLTIARRCPDGTVIFFAPAGVQIPTEHDEPDILNPAWLAMHSDGRVDRPLPPALINDQKPDACTLRCVRDEWIVDDDAGFRHLVGNAFEPILSPEEKRFSELVGIDARHRWVFHDRAGDYLLIDPLVADPTPRLPVWVIPVDKGQIGWDTAGFPVVTRDNQPGRFELNETSWKLLDAGEQFTSQLPTTPATTQATEAPILKTSDGTEYFDGKNNLIVQKSTGEKITWPLPAPAVGSLNPTLLQTPDGLLFLYNQPGRLLRFRPTPNEAEPFKLEANFTKDIPNSDAPVRIWLDPAGRIDFITEDNLLTIAFPDGHIPKEISRMILTPK